MGSGKSTLAKKLRDKYDIVEGTDLGEVVEGKWVTPPKEERVRLGKEKEKRLIEAHRAGKRVLLEGVPPGIEHYPDVISEADRMVTMDPGYLTRMLRLVGRSFDRGTSLTSDIPFALRYGDKEVKSLERLRELIADQHTVESSEEAEKLLEAVLSKKASVTVPYKLLLEANQDPFLRGYVHPRSKERVRAPIIHEGEIVGFYSPRVNEGTGRHRVGAIYVKPEHRGKGLASRAISDYAGDRPANAFVGADNEASRRAFLAAGFVEGEYDSRQDGHWFYKGAKTNVLREALSKKSSVTKEDIHNLADDLNIPWDDDPDFMDYSERVTGKTCLDKMTPSELEDLKKSLKGRAKTAKLTHPEQRLKERTGLPLSAYTKLKKALKSKGFKTPKGVHHFKLDGEGYAVVKNVKGKPVISSFLTRHMAPPGQDLTARVGKELIEKSLRGKGRLKSGSAEEFAPGIPADRKTHDLPTTKAKWRLAVQLHKANKAGPHWDLRLVDPESGHAHSWAVPKREWPTAKKRLRLAIMQPTHTADYSTWQGTIPEGTYGAGDVELLRDEETDVDVSPDVVRFNVPGVGPMVMHRGEGDQWKLLLGRTGTQGGT
tara:strand:+ start:1821 stop:3620 length:1800 start_codon:yes stop_codon:yes gene_type:complete